MTGALDLTNRNRIQGRQAAGNRAMDRDARYSFRPRGGKSGRAYRQGHNDLPWEISMPAMRLSTGQPGEKGLEKSAEAVVAAASKRRGSPPSTRRVKGRIF
jgi:hypothetical protein